MHKLGGVLGRNETHGAVVCTANANCGALTASQGRIEGWRSQARAMGLQQAQRFSWSKCARETLAVYQTVAHA